MTKISPEVLIYLQTVKTYLNNSKDAKDYFIGESNEELFFQHLLEISQKNFDSSGEAMLNKEQFELLRKTVIAVTISKKDIKEETKTDYENVFIEIQGFGKICLN
jgi:hypothetical protein